MRGPSRTIRLLSVLAIAIALVVVYQDATGRLPFWWSDKSATAYFGQHVSSAAGNEHRLHRALREIPVRDRRGLSILTPYLAHENAAVRQQALAAMHEHIDAWRLDLDGTGGRRLTDLLHQLESLLKKNPAYGSPENRRGLGTSTRSIVERVQAMRLDDYSDVQQNCSQVALRIIERLPPMNSKRTAIQPTSPGAIDLDSTLDLPGGGLPLNY